MHISTFIRLYEKAFGADAPLPLLFFYSDTPLAETEKINGCFFKALHAARQGHPVSLHADAIGCGGGKFYTGFSEMPEHVPHFVSVKERYKQTPEMVLDFIAQTEVMRAEKKYLNFIRLDRAESFDTMEGLLFFATPDQLAGLCTWAFYDNNAPDAVAALFGSGCANVVATARQENRRNGRRTFLGLFDPSVRPYVGADELSFVIPACRFPAMYATLLDGCLFDTPAWAKVKARLQAAVKTE